MNNSGIISSVKGFTQINEKISIKFSEKVLEIKKEVLSDFI